MTATERPVPPPAPEPPNRAAPAVGADAFEARRARALKNCGAQVRFFTGKARQARLLYRGFQIATIVLGGLTPVVLLADLPVVSTEHVAALFAALAAIAAGLSGAFHLQEAWVRNAYFGQALTSELEKYATRTTVDYGMGVDDEVALSAFVERVEALRMAEASQWRDYERAATTPGTVPAGPGAPVRGPRDGGDR